jgi:hypothetical protein
MIHEVYRTEEAAERRRSHSVDHAGLEVEEHRARHVLVARGFVVKHVDVLKLRFVAVTAD